MALTPIPLSDYPAIRQAIDVGLTDADLADSTIGLTIYAGRAEDWARDRDPLLETRTGREARAIARAMVYYCAALLVARVAIPTSETFGDYRYTLPATDVEALKAELQSLADGEIAIATGDDSASEVIPTLFTSAPGGRRPLRVASAGF